MPPQEPSGMLVSLVDRVRTFWADDTIPLAQRQSVLEQARAANFSFGRPAPHFLEEGELLLRVQSAAALLSSDNAAIGEKELIDLLSAIQLLDAWHRAIIYDLSGEQWPVLQKAHLDAQSRLLADGAFNSDTSQGKLVPRYGQDWRLCPEEWILSEIAKDFDEGFDDSAHLDLRAYLSFTSVLPNIIEASSPDDGKGPPRSVDLEYIASFPAVAPPAPQARHKILVAPALHAEAEVAISVHQERYFVQPVDLCDRMDALAKEAFAAEGTVLFLPEMTLSSGSLTALQAALRKRHGEWSAQVGGQPRLIYAIVGVAEPHGDDTRNYVAVLTGTGELITEQDKLSRWDLDSEAQQWLGLGHVADVLEEAIEPSASVKLLELPGLGRLLILICADMNIGEPGNFLYVNGAIDWVYAPIMDRTWRLKRDGKEEDWIVERARRAAIATKGNVVVSNSLPLTLICNRTNDEHGLSYPPATHCQVGLLLDGRDDRLMSKSLSSELASPAPIISGDWFDGWEEFIVRVAP